MAEWTRRQLKDDAEVWADLQLTDVKLVVYQDAGVWKATLPGYRHTLRPLAATTLETAQAEALTVLREFCTRLDYDLAEVGV